MADFTTNKAPGSQLGSAEWNQLADVDNFTTSASLTPSTVDLDQIAKAAAVYAGQGGIFGTDSGVADVYVFTQISPLLAPPVATLKIGTTVVFRPGNNNTGACTLNAFAHGVKNIKIEDGLTNPSVGDLSTTRDIKVIWDGTVWRISGRVDKIPTVQTFTASGTWNKPAGLRYAQIEVQAGGAGGSGAAASRGNAGGGAGGGARKLIATSALGSSETVTVGTGGAAGAGGGNNPGLAGGSSSFGAHASATGGTNSGGSAAAGLGGVGASGDINITGGASQSTDTTASNTAAGGSGGNGMFAGGGPGGLGIGGPGTNGGGGAGGHNATAGGAGGDGIIIIHEFY